MATKLQQRTGMIGPTAWRNSSMKNIERSQYEARHSDQSTAVGRRTDPLPHLREVLAGLSNEQARTHFRQTRNVVHILRDTLIDLNAEIRSLVRTKENLEKAGEQVRQAIRLNDESQQTRTMRPPREACVKDGASDLLEAERLHLNNLKRSIETDLLQRIQQQLRQMEATRHRLSAVHKERSKVLGLISEALPANSSAGSLEEADGAMMMTDPLGAYTPEAEAALNEAKRVMGESRDMRKETGRLADRSDEVVKQALKATTDVLAQKIIETAALKRHLDKAAAKTRLATNRAQRMFDITEHSWLQNKGPESQSDLISRERLNRPIIRTFQGHPGNNLPEAQELVRADSDLLTSLRRTGRNIGSLKLAHLQLTEDKLDKKAAMDVDESVLRMRRRHAIQLR